MAKVKISEQEQKECIELIQNYRKMHDGVAETLLEMKTVQEKLKELNDQKDKIVAGIEANRANEAEWVKKMIANYGTGKLNLELMEWTSDEPQAAEGTPEAPKEMSTLQP